MRASIEPLSAVPDHLLKDHLLRYGLKPEVIEWKYFDRVFKPGGERGYAWLRHDRVEGMIGLIPFALAGPGARRACAWTCDWFVGASKQNPGIGVLLLKAAIEREALLVTIGGNELTSRLVPRMAAYTDADAAAEWVQPLRVGGTSFFGRVQRRLPIAGVRQVGNVVLPRRAGGRLPPGMTLRSEPGVSRAVLDLVADVPPETWAPAYDAGHLDWHLVRCPEVESGSVFAQDGAQVPAAALFWRLKSDRRLWRLVFWLRPGEVQAARAVLVETARLITSQHGQSVATLVARRDTDATSALRLARFCETERVVPFYALANQSPAPITTFSRLGFLDSDLGFRF